MPIAHASCFVRFVRYILIDVVLVLGSARYTGNDADSVSYIKAVMRYGRIDAVNLPPHVLTAVAANSEGLSLLSTLRFIGWGGAPLPEPTGDLLAATCRNTFLHNSQGSSEGGAFVCYATDSKDWEWQCYCPTYNGIVWEQLCEGDDNDSDSGLYEMIIEKRPELELFQGAFKTFPQLSKWSTRDLYAKHPVKANHWRYVGCFDNMVVMPNRGKFNPTTLHERVESHAAIKTAVMIGGAEIISGRRQRQDQRQTQYQHQRYCWS